MIKTVNLQKVYTTEEVETTALNNVNIDIDEGEFVAVMGPSGCGKSTLLNVLGLLDNPSGGEYFLNEEEVSKHSERQRANTRKSNIGFVFPKLQPHRRTDRRRKRGTAPALSGLTSQRAQTAPGRIPRIHGHQTPRKAFPAAIIRRSAAARGCSESRHSKPQHHPRRRANG